MPDAAVYPLAEHGRAGVAEQPAPALASGRERPKLAGRCSGGSRCLLEEPVASLRALGGDGEEGPRLRCRQAPTSKAASSPAPTLLLLYLGPAPPPR